MLITSNSVNCDVYIVYSRSKIDVTIILISYLYAVLDVRRLADKRELDDLVELSNKLKVKKMSVKMYLIQKIRRKKKLFSRR